MSKRQLEQLRQTLDSIVEDLSIREKAVDEEHTQLQARLAELGVRQMRIESLEDALCVHQASESDLVTRLESLLGELEQRSAQQPQWLASELQNFQKHLLSQLGGRLSGDLESLLASKQAELVRELQSVEGQSLNALTERLSASLQTALSVQLAPLSDDLPDRLTSILQSALPPPSGATGLALPELVRELEKLETRSMASMAARMTAGLQAAMATQLSALTEDLPRKIAAAVSAAVVPGATLASTSGTSPSCDAATTAGPGDAASAARVVELSDELARVKAALAEAEGLLVEALENAPPSAGAAAQDVAARLAAVETDRVRLNDELEQTRAQLLEATSRSPGREPGLDCELVDALRAEVSDLRSLLAAKEHDALLLEDLRAEINALRAASRAAGANGDQVSAAADEVLREQLERASCQIVDLRSINEELSERIAQLQINTTPHGPMPHLGQEGLSWEERKRLLLQQLDAEQSQDDAADVHIKRIEVDEILRTTELELERRDREIAELRSLLQQQSDAREGMAVGAAAVAQLIESDELVQQEREKLRAIQRSWDEKFRQAEIDLSMERAKLARERLHLEEQKQELERELQLATAAAAAVQADPAAKPGDARSRKWLSRLGLKDET